MIKRYVAFMGLVGIIIAGVLSGCAPSRLEAHHGVCFHQALANQTLDPEAYKNLEPQKGLDGQAAKTVMDTYRKTFEKEVEMSPMIAISGTR
jgi:hypothetical protein